MYVDFSGMEKVVGGSGSPDTPEISFTTDIEDAVVAFLGGDGRPYCTGTCIAPNIVLTAAHCPIEKGDRVGVGADMLSPKTVAKVRLIERNPAWSRTLSDHALVLLDRELDVASPKLSTAVVPGQAVQTVGYGLTSAGSRSQTLKWWLAETVDSVSNNDFVISGEGRHGLCNGDSGGPAFSADDHSNPVIVGTVSMGASSCVGEDRFSRVSASLPWIQETAASLQERSATIENEIHTASASMTGLLIGGILLTGFLLFAVKK